MYDDKDIEDNFQLYEWVQDLELDKNTAIFLVQSICDRFSISKEDLGYS